MWAWMTHVDSLQCSTTDRQAPKKARAGMACRAYTSLSQTTRIRLQRTRSQHNGSAPLGVILSPEEKSSRLSSHQLSPRLGACSYYELTLQNSAPLPALLKALQRTLALTAGELDFGGGGGRVACIGTSEKS